MDKSAADIAHIALAAEVVVVVGTCTLVAGPVIGGCFGLRMGSAVAVDSLGWRYRSMLAAAVVVVGRGTVLSGFGIGFEAL